MKIEITWKLFLLLRDTLYINKLDVVSRRRNLFAYRWIFKSFIEETNYEIYLNNNNSNKLFKLSLPSFLVVNSNNFVTILEELNWTQSPWIARDNAIQKRRQRSITRKSIFPANIGAYCSLFSTCLVLFNTAIAFGEFYRSNRGNVEVDCRWTTMTTRTMVHAILRLFARCRVYLRRFCVAPKMLRKSTATN